MAKILITGGAGYLGRAIGRALARAGHAVTLSDRREGPANSPRVARCELTDEAATRALLEAIRPDAIVHCAGLIQVGESVREPERYWRVNTGGSISLLAAARAAGARAVVFSSTAAVYGEPREIPIPESHPLAPVSPYGRSKAAVEGLLADCEAAGGPRWAALRYFNASGAEPDGSDGEDHEPETHLIPLVFRALRRGEPVKIFGADYETADGTCLRDYVHVADLAEGHRLAIERLLSGGASLACNLGTGRGATVREVIAACARVSGFAARVAVEPRRPGDSAALVADPALAARELGFTARRDLDAIVRDAWGWESKR